MRPVCDFLDYSDRGDRLAGGVRMLPVHTPAGTFKVWTKRIGNNPTLRVLLLHGGPGATHEYLETCDSYLPAAGIEYYYYDQLGSAFSQSWGGILATEYALAHPDRLKGLVISNMMADVPAYNAYARDVLKPAMDQKALEVPHPGHRRASRHHGPAHMQAMAERLPRGRYLHCPEGSHLAMYDDQRTYFSGLIDFLHGL